MLEISPTASFYLILTFIVIFLILIIILFTISLSKENQKTNPPVPPPTTSPTTSPTPTIINPSTSPVPTTKPPLNIPSVGVIRLQRVFPNLLLTPNENIIELVKFDLYNENGAKIPYTEYTAKFGIANNSITPTQQSLTYNENLNDYGVQNLLSETTNKIARTKGSELLNRIFVELKFNNNQSRKISKVILKINPSSDFSSSIALTQLQLYRSEDIVNNIPSSQPVFIESIGPRYPINSRNEIVILVDNNSNKNCSDWKQYYCPFFTTQN